MIQQGAIYWVDVPPPRGSEPGFLRPHVVVQNDLFNRSTISTVIICGLTTNLRRGVSPGNVMLRTGEGNLPRKSVVNVTQMLTVDKSSLGRRIGQLSAERMAEVLAGIRRVLEPGSTQDQ